MENNRLTAKYIKDVFRFMKMYHIVSTGVGETMFFIDGGEYHIINEDEHEWHTGANIKELLDSFKKSKLYMMELI